MYGCQPRQIFSVGTINYLVFYITQVAGSSSLSGIWLTLGGGETDIRIQ